MRGFRLVERIALVAVVCGCFSIISSSPSQASGVRHISASQAEGKGGSFPTITVWPGSGTNVNFIPTGEVVKKVWLDDPSRIVIDADGSLCIQSNGSGCTDGGASVIHLRRIKKINFPNLPQTPTTLLSVVTENAQGERKLYQFRVTYGTGTPTETTISVNPDVQRPDPRTTEGILVRLDRIQRGLERAEQTGMIHPTYGNQVISSRVRTFLAWGRSGVPLEQAAARTGLPPSLLGELEALGRTFESLPPGSVQFTSTPPSPQPSQPRTTNTIPWLDPWN